MDRDGDGYIGVNDLRRQYATQGTTLDKAEVRDIIFEVDEDRDGLVRQAH